MMNNSIESTPNPATVSLPVVASLAPCFRILHVNDSTDDQILFQAACRKAGVPFDWQVADSAEKGISYLRALVQQSGKVPVCWPDLVLLDVMMPVVSGFEVLKYIRATPELKYLPVVVFTGQLCRSATDDSIMLGANAIRSKPCNFEQIVSLARELHQMLRDIKA
jgi:CheY-like chemotaxis protein